MTNRIRSGPGHFLRAGLLIALLPVLAGCATGPAGEDKALVERAQARWDALTANDLETAYGYYSPGYRSATSLIDFGVELRTRRVHWTSAEYVDHRCEASRCSVRFNVGFHIGNPVPGVPSYDDEQLVEETWVRIRDEWWYLPEI